MTAPQLVFYRPGFGDIDIRQARSGKDKAMVRLWSKNLLKPIVSVVVDGVCVTSNDLNNITTRRSAAPPCGIGL